MGVLLNQITIFTSLLFTLGLLALFVKRNHSKQFKGTIIVFFACIINFSVFSNFNSHSAEGQVIGLLILVILSIHLFTQKYIINTND